MLLAVRDILSIRRAPAGNRRLLFGVANDGTVHGIAKDRLFQDMDGIVNSISDA